MSKEHLRRLIEGAEKPYEIVRGDDHDLGDSALAVEPESSPTTIRADVDLLLREIRALKQGLGARMAAVEADLEHLAGVVATVQGHLDRLTSVNHAFVQETSRRNFRQVELVDRLEQMVRGLESRDSISRELVETQMRFEELARAYRQTQDQVDPMRRSTESLKAEVDDLHSRLREALQDNDRVRAELAKAYRQAQDQVDPMRRSTESLEDEVLALRSRLRNAQEVNENVVAELAERQRQSGDLSGMFAIDPAKVLEMLESSSAQLSAAFRRALHAEARSLAGKDRILPPETKSSASPKRLPLRDIELPLPSYLLPVPVRNAEELVEFTGSALAQLQSWMGDPTTVRSVGDGQASGSSGLRNICLVWIGDDDDAGSEAVTRWISEMSKLRVGLRAFPLHLSRELVIVRSTSLIDSVVEALLRQSAPLGLAEIDKTLPKEYSRSIQAVANLLGRLDFIQGGRRHSQRWGGSRGYELPMARLADADRQRLVKNLEPPSSSLPVVPVAWGPGFLSMLGSLRSGTAVRIDGAGNQRSLAHAVAAGLGTQSIAAS